MPPKTEDDDGGFVPHTSHWGVFKARMREGELEVIAHAGDPDPSDLIHNFPAALRHNARIDQPYVRRGWLEDGPGSDDRRGSDEYVALPWPVVLDKLAAEVRRVRDDYGPQAIFGGSYGWASAGRFHHAQSQIHRFLNKAVGGYVRSVNSYSSGASSVIIPHVLGDFEDLLKRNVTWEQIASDTEILVAFGGMALKNSMVAGGSISRHVEKGAMQRASDRGCEFILVSPLSTDLPPETRADWVAAIPGSDAALMLAMIHTLVVNDLHDRAFLERFTVGWPVFEQYLLGSSDGQPKDAAWAAPITGVSADEIVTLALRLHGKRALIVVAHSLQRAAHGEQPVWLGMVLSAVLGQIGLPGGGYGYGLGAIAYYGRRGNAVPIPTLPQGRNAVNDFIPVARIADMLLNPGSTYRYNGATRVYPDIKLVYWAGGNPFHHHQDLNRLRKAFARTDTIVVHELAWTATARHADIVLPCTMTLEREDIGASSADPLLVPMHPVTSPFGQARDDYEIFADLAERLGKREYFTEGRNTRQWLEYLFQPTRAALTARGLPAPTFDEFWASDGLEVPQEPDDGGKLRAFRNHPEGAPLATPSGRLEIYSEKIASFGETDCLGHPAWLGATNVTDNRTPLVLIANQPRTRLHSQLDFGVYSDDAKHRGREVATLHPDDAAARGIAQGDIILISNDRGACLAAANLSDAIRPGVIQLPTGAWYDPAEPRDAMSICVHGNPNILTDDVGTSSLAQGCTGQLTTVEVERFKGNLPEIKAHTPPPSASVDLMVLTKRK